jgi:hypothetical protein
MSTPERDSTIAKALRGLAPARWGSAGWTFLHYVALSYPSLPSARHVREYGEFVHSLQNVLTCESCRDTMARHLREMPPDASLRAGKHAFFAWTVDLHNAVNRELGKPSLDAASSRSGLLKTARPGLVAALIAACILLSAGLASILSAHIFKTHVKG